VLLALTGKRILPLCPGKPRKDAGFRDTGGKRRNGDEILFCIPAAEEIGGEVYLARGAVSSV
jgi:hypothetical protein